MTELQPIQSKIYEIRGKRVMLDFDLAQMYQVETRRLKEQVRRNYDRFPPEFMFPITKEEYNTLILNMTSQNATSNLDSTRYMPFAFTEQGVAMLSAVLNSPIAIKVSIQIMNAFVVMREHLTNTNLQSAEIRELRLRIRALELGNEETIGAVNDMSEDFRKELDEIYLALSELSEKRTLNPRRPIGYDVPRKDKE